METQNSPYRPPLTSEQGRSLTPRWLPHLAGALAVLSAVVFALLLVLKPDVERYLADSMPGNHMQDAFDHLNRSIPIFVGLMTISLALLFAITLKERYSLVVPLLAGPMIGLMGWLVTENFQDQNWFHFVANKVSHGATEPRRGAANGGTELLTIVRATLYPSRERFIHSFSILHQHLAADFISLFRPGAFI